MARSGESVDTYAPSPQPWDPVDIYHASRKGWNPADDFPVTDKGLSSLEPFPPVCHGPALRTGFSREGHAEWFYRSQDKGRTTRGAAWLNPAATHKCNAGPFYVTERPVTPSTLFLWQRMDLEPGERFWCVWEWTGSPFTAIAASGKRLASRMAWQMARGHTGTHVADGWMRRQVWQTDGAGPWGGCWGRTGSGVTPPGSPA